MIDIPIFIFGISGIGITGSGIKSSSAQGVGISGCPRYIILYVIKAVLSQLWCQLLCHTTLFCWSSSCYSPCSLDKHCPTSFYYNKIYLAAKSSLLHIDFKSGYSSRNKIQYLREKQKCVIYNFFFFLHIQPMFYCQLCRHGPCRVGALF